MGGRKKGWCVGCGRQRRGLVDDHCSDCYKRQFLDGLEKCPLMAGDAVDVVRHGHRSWIEGVRVAENFSGGWLDDVWVLYPDSPLIVSYPRSRLVKLSGSR